MSARVEPPGKGRTRRCPKCGKDRPFYSDNTPYCKECFRNYQRMMHHLRKFKPILLKRQRGRCAICRTNMKDFPVGQQHVDHLHDTGLVRGLLCKPCNTGLGMFRDDVKRLRAAADYLEASEPFDPRLG